MDNTAPSSRLWFAAFFAVVLAIVLIWRWNDLQVERFKHFSELAQDNQIVVLPIEPPRGKIWTATEKFWPTIARLIV